MRRRAIVGFLGCLLVAASAGAVDLLESAKIKGGSIEFLFNLSERQEKKLPGWCESYLRFSSPEKRRPMYVYGWGSGGTITATFDNQDGMSEEFRLKVVGEATSKIDRYSCQSGNDWQDFACGTWIRKGGPEPPAISVTIKNFSNIKWDNKEAQVLMNPNRPGTPKPGREGAKLEATASVALVLAVNQKSLELPNTPCRFFIRDMTGRWNFKIRVNSSFMGEKLGLMGSDTGKIDFYYTCEGYNFPPESHRPKAATGKGMTSGDAIDALSAPDMDDEEEEEDLLDLGL